MAAAMAFVAGLAAWPAEARTLRTITIDGNLDDWSAVLIDPDQKVADRSLAQGDPDMPGQAQRDERGVAFTWDATRFYLYFSRTGSGSNSFNAIFYLDLDHDGLLEGTDRVAFLKFSGSSFNGFEIVQYADGGTPDPMTGDGVAPAGTGGAWISNGPATAQGDPNGIAFEAAIPWTTLGVAPGAPMLVHPALSANTNLPGGVQDNTDVLDTRLVVVGLTPGATRAAAPGRTASFAHVVTNGGTTTDVIDLSLRTRLGFATEVWSDPNGDGNPADGVLLARDANGDGDTSDLDDTPPSAAHDANGNDVLDGGALAAGASRAFVLRVAVPAFASEGQEETVHVVASSDYKPSKRRTAQDVIRVAALGVTPDRAAAAATGAQAFLAHEACNGSGSPLPVSLELLADAGWAVEARSDPDGNGDPSDGWPLPDADGDGLFELGTVADGACTPFVVLVTVPAGAADGDVGAVDVVAVSGARSGAAADTVEALLGPVVVRPEHDVRGQRRRTLYLAHEAVNGAPATQAFAVSGSSAIGGQVAIHDDPDGDGSPDDSTIIAATAPVPGSGGATSLLTRVRIPAGATHGTVDLVSTTATGAAVGTGTAVDRIVVSDILTYSDALFARPSTEFFGQCATVHVLAFRTGGGTYRFQWTDPTGAVQRLSADISPYADGSLDDFFDCGASPALGTWTIKLQQRSGGSNYVDVGPSGTTTFEVRDLVAGGARIQLLDAGADIYEQAGDPLTAWAELSNPTSVDILGSRTDYVAFRDANGDGAPSAGEDHVRPDGSVAPWAAGLRTFTRLAIDVYAGEQYGDAFRTPAVTYPVNGPWTIEATWTATCGFLLSRRTMTYTVGCQPAPSFDGVASADDVDPCRADGILLAWSPATSWGLGTTGTYVVHRSSVLGFVPDASTIVASGLTGTSWLDTGAAPGRTWSYVVRAESDVTCSDGPHNGGLQDGNFVHAEAADEDFGEPPRAAFTHSAPECLGPAGATLSFSDLSSGPPTEIEWDFDGDGAADATGPSAAWTFTSAGSHDVTLTVRNPCGDDVLTRSVVVTEPPSAAIQVSFPNGAAAQTCAGSAADFHAFGSVAVAPATLVAWAWDLDGDGDVDSTDADPAPWTYAAAGRHLVALTVTDSEGCTATATTEIVVHDTLAASLALAAATSCGGDVEVAASVTGGLPPYAFAWDGLVETGPGTAGGVLPQGATTRVAVTVTDAAGCTASASLDVDVLPALGLGLDPVTVDPCTGRVTLEAHADGGDGAHAFTFALLAHAGGSAAGVLAPGAWTETVTVTDGRGCTATATVDFTVPEPPSVSFQWSVAYVGPDDYRADLVAAGRDGTAPHAFGWDVGADGSVDATGPTLSLPLRANETVAVELVLTDAAGCEARDRQDVTSGGCPADAPLRQLMVRKDGAGLAFTWEASSHACHGRYDLLVADTARPALTPAGSWPTDPAFTSLRTEDADGSDRDPALRLADPRTGTNLYVLVRDGGTDGSWGPVESYGSTGVTR